MGDEDVDYVSSRLGISDQLPILVTARSHGNRSRMSVSSVRSTNTSLLGNNILLAGERPKLPSIRGKSPRGSNALSIATNSKSPRISVISDDDFFIPEFNEKTLVSRRAKRRPIEYIKHRTHLIQMQTTRVRVSLLKNDLNLMLTLMCDLDLDM